MIDDAETIEAVKSGEHERFAELVDRHQGLAYAIAWSRLGDEVLAEEAAQESFVRAFRYLGALKDPRRFAGWLGQIVRNAAGMIGRREQRELETKKRWTVERDAAETGSDADAPTAEDVESAMAELADEHREALVLFYFRGESTASAAEIVGVNEGAFRTRLTRARKKLRQAIERRMEKELTQLRPRRNLTPLVIAALPGAPIGASAAAAIGTVGGKAVGGLLKGTMWFMLWPILQIPLVWGLAFWSRRAAVDSFRDPNDERAGLMRGQMQSSLIVVLCIVLWMFLTLTLGKTFGLGPESSLQFIALLLAAMAVPVLLRWQRIDRSAAGLIMGLSIFAACSALIFMAFFDGPLWVGYLSILPSALMQLIAPQLMGGSRMDYHLFLRAALGGLGKLVDRETNLQLSDVDLQRFAWWMGARRLIADRRIDAEGMTLDLPNAKPNGFEHLRPWRRRDVSTIRISRTGICTGDLSVEDYHQILDVVPRAPMKVELEADTLSVFRSAAHAFFANEIEEAERLLTRETDKEVFRRQPLRTIPNVCLQSIVVLYCGWLAVQGFSGKFDYRPRNAGGEVPVFSDAAAMTHLKPLILAMNAYPEPGDSAALSLWSDWRFGRIEFPVHRLDAEGLAALREGLLQRMTVGGRRPIEEFGRHWTSNVDVTHKLIFSGLFSAQELVEFDITRARVREEYGRRAWYSKFPLYLGKGKVRDRRPQNFSIHSGKWQELEVLKHFDSLDLVPADLIASELVLLQVGHDSVVDETMDRQALHGWFLAGRPSLETCWLIVRVLDALGKLDRIDREAFVEGILRLHHGRGVFGERNRKQGFKLSGDVATTFYALDCLLILRAGDRIDDLADWRFRAQSVKRNPSSPEISQYDLRAWIYTERLRELLQLPALPNRFFSTGPGTRKV